MTALGTLAWAHATGGTLTADDEAVLAGQIPYLLEQGAQPATSIALDIDDLAPPDSALTRDAEELWRANAPMWLLGHGHRTWYYAAALERIWNLGADPELLYCAALLHDLGLTPDHGPTAEHPCFAVTGALAARRVVARHRPDGADVVAEAIAMHLNVRIEHDGPIQQLVPAGTLVDVTGLRLQLVPRALVVAINRRYPRATFGAEVGDAFARCAAAYPATRCGWLERTLNVSSLTRQHPLD